MNATTNTSVGCGYVDKGIIYYTDGLLGGKILAVVQDQITKGASLPIVNVSLKPSDFGKNIVLSLKPGILSMYKQIVAGLEESKADVVFFCEHDVLYHPSHFDFIPSEPNVFYYNVNVWRWKYPEDLAITYENIVSLSSLCVNREFALNHYKYRLTKIYEMGWDKITNHHEPYWCRLIGHEPGTKRTRRGGITNDRSELWRSEFPNIDIRHDRTFTRQKCTLAEFKHPPEITTWKERRVNEIEGWTGVKEMFI